LTIQSHNTSYLAYVNFSFYVRLRRIILKFCVLYVYKILTFNIRLE